MTPFIRGFCDELEKLGGIGGMLAKGFMKRPLLYGFTGYGGYAGAKAATKPKERKILTRPGQPTPAFYTDYHRALGLKRKMTKPERYQASKYFAKYREKK